MQSMCLLIECCFVSSDPWATETSLKKSDNATVVSKNSWAYMATMTVDFLVIVLPILLFLTVSFLQ